MYTVTCPQCSTRFEIAEARSGQDIICPECGLSMEITPDLSLIPLDARFENHSQDLNGHFAESDTSGATQRRIFEMHRVYTDNSGCCCGSGCIFIVLFILLALRGCLALF